MGFSYKIKKECLLSPQSPQFCPVPYGSPFILWAESDFTLCTSVPVPIFGQVAENRSNGDWSNWGGMFPFLRVLAPAGSCHGLCCCYHRNASGLGLKEMGGRNKTKRIPHFLSLWVLGVS